MAGKQNSDSHHILRLTTDIVSSYLSHNAVSVKEIPAVLDTVHTKITELFRSGSFSTEMQAPLVPVEDSVTDDHIICLEDGKKFKMLKKHLEAHHGMTPQEYRAKWRLPPDYPMVAPNYSARRQELARASGLGKPRKPVS